jgi:hypothetical protein
MLRHKQKFWYLIELLDNILSIDSTTINKNTKISILFSTIIFFYHIVYLFTVQFCHVLYYLVLSCTVLSNAYCFAIKLTHKYTKELLFILVSLIQLVETSNFIYRSQDSNFVSVWLIFLYESVKPWLRDND